jgi:hypothetical protein
MAPVTMTPISGTRARTPGEVVEFIVRWDLPEPPKSLALLLSWTTSGKGTPDTEAVWSKDISATRARGEKQVSVTLPDGPYSFSGRLISLQWKAELVLNAETAFTWDFVLAPDGREVLLENVANAPSLR